VGGMWSPYNHVANKEDMRGALRRDPQGVGQGVQGIGLPRTTRSVCRQHPLDLLVEPQLLEQGALLAADRVRDRRRLTPVLVREDVRRVAVLQQVHLVEGGERW
jgi:hypothetical protein